MDIFKRPHALRRYSTPTIEGGYATVPYEDIVLRMDIQTTDNSAETTPEGRRSVQRLKVFCDSEIIAEDEATRQKGDRVWFQGKWFECQSSRLSENTPLRHWTATFVQCLDSEPGPVEEGGGTPDDD